jgi:hypothetical protein
MESEEHYEVRVVLSGYDECTFPGLYVEHLGSDVVSMIINLMKNISIIGVNVDPGIKRR